MKTLNRPAVATAVIAAILAFVLPAQAQQKYPPPPTPIRGCTTWLQMGNAQAKLINNDLARIEQIRSDRERKLLEARRQQLREEDLRMREERLRIREKQLESDQKSAPPSDASSATIRDAQSAPLGEPRADASLHAIAPEVTASFDRAIMRIEILLEGKKRKLAGIDRVYRRCIEKPPQVVKDTKPAPKAKKGTRRG